jgi:hypothetical protein
MLDGEHKLTLPAASGKSSRASDDGATPFLWQAPSSDAILYLGSKWVDLHDFVSRSLDAKRNPEATPALLKEKLVSNHHPAWLEHALQLSRLRGYWTLYPGQEVAQNLATVHNDLFQAPEEYADQQEQKKTLADDATEEEIDAAIRAASEVTLAPMSLLDSLPNSGNLPNLGTMPMVSWDGEKTTLDEAAKTAREFTAQFKREVGGCTSTQAKQSKDTLDATFLTQSLFCDPKKV